jgi:hypothetical protein
MISMAVAALGRRVAPPGTIDVGPRLASHPCRRHLVDGGVIRG